MISIELYVFDVRYMFRDEDEHLTSPSCPISAEIYYITMFQHLGKQRTDRMYNTNTHLILGYSVYTCIVIVTRCLWV